MKSLSESSATLTRAVKELVANWELTATQWRDEARSGFEKEYIDELTRQAQAAAQAMAQIETMLREAAARCR